MIKHQTVHEKYKKMLDHYTLTEEELEARNREFEEKINNKRLSQVSVENLNTDLTETRLKTGVQADWDP